MEKERKEIQEKEQLEKEGSILNNSYNNNNNPNNDQYLRQRNKYFNRIGITKNQDLSKVKEKNKRLLEDKSMKNLEREVIWTPRIRTCYMVMVLFKLLAEVYFLYFQYILQTFMNPHKQQISEIFKVPERYICEVGKDQDYDNPCSQNDQIMCWNIRPWEKTILLYYMTSLHLLCIATCLLEFFWIPASAAFKSMQKNSIGNNNNNNNNNNAILGANNTENKKKNHVMFSGENPKNVQDEIEPIVQAYLAKQMQSQMQNNERNVILDLGEQKN